MRIAADHYVNGARPSGAIEQQQCVELRAANGAAWANVFLDGEPAPTEAQIIQAEGEEPQTVAIAANPSGAWPTVPLAAGAEISARAGYPRLVLP